MLVADGRLRKMNIIYLVASISNIGLNIYLIPSYGALGAAFTSLICQLCVAVAMVVSAHSMILKVSVFSIWKRILVFVLITSGVIWGLYENLLFEYLSNIYAHIIVITIGVVIVAYFTGLLRVKEMWQLLQKRKT
jgi:O-antigen/teichoic acid export membrane protein